MKNYLLTVIGTFGKDNEKVCKEIANSIYPLVDSPDLRFIYGNEVLIYHFASDVCKEEIFFFIDAILIDITKTYILTEVEDNFTISLTKDTNYHLMNLGGAVSDDSVNLMDRSRIKRTIDIENFEDWFHDEDDDFISKLKKPSLNEILDKISVGGYHSLSDIEKMTLENYSKN